MSITTRKKRSSIVVVVIGALVMAGAAFAYWTAGGSGTGTASAGTNAPLTAVQNTGLTPMFPGDTAQTISGKFNNPNPGVSYVTSVTVSISSVTKAAGADAGTCDASDFTLANTVMSVNADVPTGNAQGAFTGATIKFNNKASNQNQCKNATVNLAFAIA